MILENELIDLLELKGKLMAEILENSCKNVFVPKFKENFDKAINRVYAWYEGQVVDRVPICFIGHNSDLAFSNQESFSKDGSKRWFDSERVVNDYINFAKNSPFLAETFPVFIPNLGPDVYAAFYGCELVFGKTTSWSKPCVKKWEDISKLNFNKNNEYFKKIEELTFCAVQKCENNFFVGYTDLHPGLDCVAAWRGAEQLCFDLIESSEKVSHLIKIASSDFLEIFNYFDSILKKHNHPSITWMGIPSFEKMHIPSCDFATMLSPKQYMEFVLPTVQNEVRHIKHNVFHLDGRGAVRHIDMLLDIPEINAIQWVQGVGDDEPIMKWLELIKKIQSAGKSVVVNLKKQELEEFIDNMKPEGLFLYIDEQNEQEQEEIIERVKKW